MASFTTGLLEVRPGLAGYHRSGDNALRWSRSALDAADTDA
jgi:hypothetical protein